jgi:hypothetical protein
MFGKARGPPPDPAKSPGTSPNLLTTLASLKSPGRITGAAERDRADVTVFA